MKFSEVWILVAFNSLIVNWLIIFRPRMLFSELIDYIVLMLRNWVCLVGPIESNMI